MNVDKLKKNLHDVIERYHNKAEFTGEVCRDVMARDCLNAIEELQAENERLKAENLKHREDNVTMSLKYNEVLNDINDENEKLKKESNWLRSDRATAWNMNEKSCEEACKLRKENAKLKCLALHAISEVVRLTAMVSRMFTKTKGIYGHWYNPLLLTEGAIQSAYYRAHRLHNAYRKMKKALMEGT